MKSHQLIARTLPAMPALILASCRTPSVPAVAADSPAPVLAPVNPETIEETLARVYEETKTPHKIGVVLRADPGKKIDCPTVFRHGETWWMIYVQLEADSRGKPSGYTTHLATNDDLVSWRKLGPILERGAAGEWDHANAGGAPALIDTTWGGSMALGTHEGRYWMTYMGGEKFGYEEPPIFIGMASTTAPAAPVPWQKYPQPVLRSDDADARAFETDTLFKSTIIRDESRTLGAPFVMFYNARQAGQGEKIGIAVSDDLLHWRRHGPGPVLENARPPGVRRPVISGDPQIVRMGDIWVMFYFGAFWKPGAFDTFAVSRDLVHWTKWEGPDLISASESWDREYAHKPWLLKHEGVVYHFYCAVGDQGRVIALATSRPLGPGTASSPGSP